MTLLEPDRSRVAPLFVDDFDRHGAQVAVMTAERSLTYEELDDLVNDGVRRLGSARRLVLVEGANTLGALVAYLAALRGRHPVLLAPPLTATGGRNLVEAYDPDVVLCAASGWVPIECRASTIHDLHPDLALLMSTSGSTGSPKLVRLSRGNLHANAAAIAAYLELTAGDRAVSTLPMQYCYGLSVINSHLHVGASVVLTDLSVVDRCFWDLFAASGATSFAGVPHTFDMLDRVGFEEMSLPTLRYVTQAGGRMHPDKVRRYAELGARRGWDLFVMYGQTEATARMAYLPPALAARRPDTIGVPIPGGTFTLDNPDGDGVGELIYRGANVMLGYADTPSDLARGATIDELRTGDLARRADDGLYEVVGRRSRFVKPFGLRVDLDRLERLLIDHGVSGVCTGDDEEVLVALEDAEDVRTATALVSGHTGVPPTTLRVVAIGELPRLSSGKTDYAAVRRRVRDHCVVEMRISPDDSGAGVDQCTALLEAFNDVLGVEATTDETFVTLGGDSLSYVEMSIRLESILATLPRDWHIVPIGTLVRARRRRRLLASMDTSAVIRAVAIVLIVGTHGRLWHVPGGAHTLLAVAGYNFARFQAASAAPLTSIARIAAPSLCWIAVVAAASDQYGWPNAVLVDWVLERPGDRSSYWFIESLVQTLALLAAVLTIPAVSRFGRRRPFAMSLVAVGVGLIFRFEVVPFAATNGISHPHAVFWLFALGWAAGRASSGVQRVIVSALALVAVPGFSGDLHREVIVLLGILAVTWVPTLAMPRVAQRLVAPLASASLYIYLTHFQVSPPLSRLYGPQIALVGCILAGVALWLLARPLIARVTQTVARRPRLPRVGVEPHCAPGGAIRASG